MTSEEFQSLTKGDKIIGMTGDIGEVSDIVKNKHGETVAISVRWSADGGPSFSHSAHARSWSHWRKHVSE